MTGEISLRGLVLPVGGIKEKVVAAVGAVIAAVMLPLRNRKDLDDIPASAREHLDFLWIEHVDEAAWIALGVDVGSEARPPLAEKYRGMTRNTPTRPGARPRVAWRRNRPTPDWTAKAQERGCVSTPPQPIARCE